VVEEDELPGLGVGFAVESGVGFAVESGAPSALFALPAVSAGAVFFSASMAFFRDSDG
jgi:hypothetical protein